MAFNFSGILGGAVVGAAAGAAMGSSWQKGAAVGAIVVIAGPMVSGLFAGLAPKPAATTPAA